MKKVKENINKIKKVKKNINIIDQQFGFGCNIAFRILDFLNFELNNQTKLQQICEKVNQEEEAIYNNL